MTPNHAMHLLKNSGSETTMIENNVGQFLGCLGIVDRFGGVYTEKRKGQ